MEPLGPVSELMIEEAGGRLLLHTAVDEIRKRALFLYEQYCEQIEAPLL